MGKTRCINCMQLIDDTLAFCPHCGYGQKQEEFFFGIRPGTILRGRYLTGRVLGQGGFGITYVGYDLTLDIKIAIKEYFPSGSVTRNNTVSNQVRWNAAQISVEQWQAGCDSFLKEARRMAKIDSLPGIVRVRDTFPENQTAYIIMDYIEGETLKQRLSKTGPMRYTECISLLRPFMESLDRIHRQGLIHRDISPDNIMIQPDGSVCLLDFGAAKDISFQQNAASQQVAKKGFSPPEQYREKGNIGPWTDVYALCASIYYCVTGRLIPDAMDRMYEDMLTFDVPSPEPLDEATVNAIRNGLKLHTEERTQTVGELLAQLEGAAAGGAGHTGRADAGDQAGSQTGSQAGDGPAVTAGWGQSASGEIRQDGMTGMTAGQPTMQQGMPAPQKKSKISKKTAGAAVAAAAGVLVIAMIRAAVSSDHSGQAPAASADVAEQTQQPAVEEDAVMETLKETVPAEDTVSPSAPPAPQLSSPPVLDSDIQEASNILMRDASGEWGEDNIYQGKVLGSQIDRDSIASVTFLDTLESMPGLASDVYADSQDMPGTAWDVSWEQDGSVMAWVEQSDAGDGLFDLYIGAQGGVKGQDCTDLFAGYFYAERIDFNGCFDTSQVTSMNGMFIDCASLTTLDVSHFDVSHVTDMAGMFYLCVSLEKLDLYHTDMDDVTNMGYMFAGCTNLGQLDVSGLSTGSVTDMSYMFAYCSSLTALDVSGFDTGSVTDMSGMFGHCSSLNSLDLSGFDLSSLKTYEGMFDESGITAWQAGLDTGEYILPESNSRYLTKNDLKDLSKEECRVARNEIFARHGRMFDDEELQAYFDSCSWYRGSVRPEDFDDSVLNEYETANRDLIVEYEKEKGYR